MKTTYDVYEDPGHGWVKVHRKELIDLGIADQISPYSYQRGEFVYLEEDRDASIFAAAKQKQKPGIKLKFREYHTDRQSKIRGYAPYQP